MRLDSTVAAALMHEPSDSSLLWDGVRVLVRLLKAADALIGGLEWRNHQRAAKKRARAIEYARDRGKRVPHYRELIKLTRTTLAYADQAATQLWRAADPMAAALWQAEFHHYRPLIERIIAQTERRVLHGEAVGANEKIVSLFEEHADICQWRRDFPQEWRRKIPQSGGSAISRGRDRRLRSLADVRGVSGSTEWDWRRHSA